MQCWGLLPRQEYQFSYWLGQSLPVAEATMLNLSRLGLNRKKNRLLNVGSSQEPSGIPAFLYPRYVARLLVGFRYHDNCWVSRSPYHVQLNRYNFHTKQIGIRSKL